MTTNKLFLLLGTSLSLVPQTLSAAECAVTDCSLLGYTDSACPGSGLKCPFGEGWYCGGGAAEDCIKLGYDKTCTGTGESGNGETCNGKYQSCTCSFPYTWNGDACSCPSTYKYTCSGTGYSGGSGSACNGKYTKCNCKSPYTWTSGACQCPSTYKYTCSGTGYSGGSGTACGGKYTKCNCKSPYTWTSRACQCPSTYKYTCSGTGYSGGSGTACGGKYTACSCASGYEWNGNNCQQQLNGAQGNLYYCNGKVVGVKGNGMNFYVAMHDLGKMDWNRAYYKCLSYIFCNNSKGSLPTANQLLSIYNNKSQINTLLSTNSGTNLNGYFYWSSTSYGDKFSTVRMVSGDLCYNCFENDSKDVYVRPVLTSW